MTRYRLEQQDSENQWRWCAIAEADDLYQLLELVPLQRAWRYRVIDMECRPCTDEAMNSSVQGRLNGRTKRTRSSN